VRVTFSLFLTFSQMESEEVYLTNDQQLGLFSASFFTPENKLMSATQPEIRTRTESLVVRKFNTTREVVAAIP